MADSNLEVLRQIAAVFRQAMAAEELPQSAADRITNRVLYGDPGGPGAIYELRPDGSKAVHMGRMPVSTGEEAARLAQVIREAVTAHEEDGPAQWYVDELTIDCDAGRFWQVAEQAIRDDGR